MSLDGSAGNAAALRAVRLQNQSAEPVVALTWCRICAADRQAELDLSWLDTDSEGRDRKQHAMIATAAELYCCIGPPGTASTGHGSSPGRGQRPGS